MAQISTLARKPRSTLAALATVLVAAGVVVGSSASFTASSANPSNTFSSGTLTMTNSSGAAAILTASGLRPGDPASTGVVDIKNSGSLSGSFALSRDTLSDSDGDNPMSGKLNLTVKDCGVTPATCDAGDPVKYSGTIAAMSSDVALGTFAANEEHRYEFKVSLDASASDAYQGDNSVVGFKWSAS
jgi:hypothetical protein